VLVVLELVGLHKPQTEATLYLQPLPPQVGAAVAVVVMERNKPRMVALAVVVEVLQQQVELEILLM